MNRLNMTCVRKCCRELTAEEGGSFYCRYFFQVGSLCGSVPGPAISPQIVGGKYRWPDMPPGNGSPPRIDPPASAPCGPCKGYGRHSQPTFRSRVWVFRVSSTSGARAHDSAFIHHPLLQAGRHDGSRRSLPPSELYLATRPSTVSSPASSPPAHVQALRDLVPDCSFSSYPAAGHLC